MSIRTIGGGWNLMSYAKLHGRLCYSCCLQQD